MAAVLQLACKRQYVEAEQCHLSLQPVAYLSLVGELDAHDDSITVETGAVLLGRTGHYIIVEHELKGGEGECEHRSRVMVGDSAGAVVKGCITSWGRSRKLQHMCHALPEGDESVVEEESQWVGLLLGATVLQDLADWVHEAAPDEPELTLV